MQIILTGSLAVDQIMNFEGTFESSIQKDKLHVLSLSVLIKELRRTRGGIAGNIAYSLALLGERPVLLASIGRDQISYIKDLAKMGVDVSYVHFSDLQTASFSVITDKNDCQVGGFYPGAMADAKNLSLVPFAKNNDALVVISAHDPIQMAVQIDEAIKNNMKIFFDVAQQVGILPEQILRKGISVAKLLILNDYEMGVLAKRINLSVEEVIQRIDTCIITLGEKGSMLYTKAEGWRPISIRPVNVPDAKDPTGAGDGFRAGFLYGYVRMWDHVSCAQFGSLVASYVIKQYGTQNHSFTIKEIREGYEHEYHQKINL